MAGPNVLAMNLDCLGVVFRPIQKITSQNDDVTVPRYGQGQVQEESLGMR